MTLRRRTAAFPIDSRVRIAAAAGLVAWEEHWGSPQRAREAWRQVSHELQHPPGTRLELWWQLAAGVPKALRERVPHPDPRDRFGGRSLSPGYHRAAAAAEGHLRARLEWLLKSGRLELDEIAAAHARLRSIDRAAISHQEL